MSAFNGPGVTFSRNSGTSTTDKKERKKGGGLINGGEFGILKSKNKKGPGGRKKGEKKDQDQQKSNPPPSTFQKVFFFLLLERWLESERSNGLGEFCEGTKFFPSESVASCKSHLERLENARTWTVWVPVCGINMRIIA